MTFSATNRRPIFAAAVLTAWLLTAFAGEASQQCPAEREPPQILKDPALCKELWPDVRHPAGLPLDQYEKKLAKYFEHYCHRDPDGGWMVDKRIRDTGPYIATLQQGKWTGSYFGTHAAVLVWYSPDMVTWLRQFRPGEGTPTPATVEPVPDGAVIVKEMYTPPAAACGDFSWEHLQPDKGIALMVRDNKASHDGWFWGWFGYAEWAPDWPPDAKNPLPNMGFGQYCTNCHGSAKDNQTFASLKNIKGERGEPLVFLSQDFFLDPSWRSHHTEVAQAGQSPSAEAGRSRDNPAFAGIFAPPGKADGAPPPTRQTVAKMPSETFDNVWVPAGGPDPSSAFVTSDQCVGCHDARGTGLQYDMTEPGGPDGKLFNISPYATWRSSPMGLAGRDPVFFAQLASETETFHRGSSAVLQGVCLGCHGIGGQRQFEIDRFAQSRQCENFSRKDVDAVPFPDTDPVAALARYGALARDGITCNACHHMVLGKEDSDRHRNAPQNRCVEARQDFLNPKLEGFAKTFSGSFFLGSPEVVNGPFEKPKHKSMKHALGMTPEHYANVKSSELCGSCHVVHLPVLRDDKVVAHIYEQTTYSEWAFSDYRTGTAPDGNLPFGPGARAQSCQDCHMPSRDAAGKPYRSKIAGIQEYSTFPQAEHALPAEDIDLKRRDGFAQHTLVGLNLFLTKMAQQFPDVLGIRTQDPMLTKAGVDPLWYTEKAMLDQARERTAGISVGEMKTDAGTLSVAVTVVNKVGHKFPSGVGFRRAFVEFSVLDEAQNVLWSSGRTDRTGVIVDQEGSPIAGEHWWKSDCSARINPDARIHQPHYAVIDAQDRAQIYEELVAAPGDGPAPVCGFGATPSGPLTTSFVSQCAKVKDNRILPHGFLPIADRTAIATALGAGAELAAESGAVAVGDDPDYRTGGADRLTYRVPLAALTAKPAAVRATLYYQATPPYFLQDRFCTSGSADTKRLYFLAANLDLTTTPAKDWKLEVVSTGLVPVP